MNNEETPGKKKLAEDRTDLAEDRTLLANERTFSGWARTALTSIGIGIGFNALFKLVEPTWIAKSIATIFILLGIFLTISAEGRAASVQRRLDAHKVTNISGINFRIMSLAISSGAVALLIAIWWLA